MPVSRKVAQFNKRFTNRIARPIAGMDARASRSSPTPGAGSGPGYRTPVERLAAKAIAACSPWSTDRAASRFATCRLPVVARSGRRRPGPDARRARAVRRSAAGQQSRCRRAGSSPSCRSTSSLAMPHRIIRRRRAGAVGTLPPMAPPRDPSRAPRGARPAMKRSRRAEGGQGIEATRAASKRSSPSKRTERRPTRGRAASKRPSPSPRPRTGGRRSGQRRADSERPAGRRSADPSRPEDRGAASARRRSPAG